MRTGIGPKAALGRPTPWRAVVALLGALALTSNPMNDRFLVMLDHFMSKST